MADKLKLLKEDEVVKEYPGLFAPSTLANWRHRNQGPAYVRIGSNIRYRPEDIEAWILSGRVDPEAAA
ncbi:Helix-turn-helix domain-containing protein [Shimia gijangensis]|uniref:Helix-turn-helix domain-containing protein n=1 Tax=Shimia gijangensis TaxID=1470563 RepID=A0A1M6DCH5_9RHOB|nr:helix-turn-helix domain-containing protein [Shimia gijangensis]SHI70883.1 Helix-turn-helix domain-containing protein [Shimia gijangensis]